MTSFLALFSLVASDIELSDLPKQLADALGCSEFIAGLIISAIFILMFTLPVAIFGNFLLSGIIGLIVTSICYALDWMPLVTMILIILLVSGIWALTWKKIGG